MGRIGQVAWNKQDTDNITTKRFYLPCGQTIIKKKCECGEWINKRSTYCKSCAELKDRNHFYGKKHTNGVKEHLSEINKTKCIDPKNHPSWRGGNTKASIYRKYICKKCGKVGIACHSKTGYCKKCVYTELFVGSKNPSWNNGSSFEPYGIEFNNDKKASIHWRDNYTCQNCGKEQYMLTSKLITHHIDYNKKNNDDFNLISLCNKCHAKTNFNRDIWKLKFKNLIIKTYGG